MLSGVSLEARVETRRVRPRSRSANTQVGRASPASIDASASPCSCASADQVAQEAVRGGGATSTTARRRSSPRRSSFVVVDRDALEVVEVCGTTWRAQRRAPCARAGRCPSIARHVPRGSPRTPLWTPFDQAEEQVFLRLDVVVETALEDPELVGDVLHGGGRVSRARRNTFAAAATTSSSRLCDRRALTTGALPSRLFCQLLASRGPARPFCAPVTGALFLPVDWVD